MLWNGSGAQAVVVESFAAGFRRAEDRRGVRQTLPLTLVLTHAGSALAEEIQETTSFIPAKSKTSRALQAFVGYPLRETIDTIGSLQFFGGK